MAREDTGDARRSEGRTSERRASEGKNGGRDRDLDRLVLLLAEDEAVGRPERKADPATRGSAAGPHIAVTAQRRGVTLRIGRAPLAAAEALASSGAALWRCVAGGRELVLSEAGFARAARLRAPEDERFLAQSADLGTVTVHDGVARRELRVNHAESPLVWLARRRNGDGQPLLDPAQVAAGERLRVDLTLASLVPRVTADWSSPIRGTGHGLTPNERSLAARQRVGRALDAVGPDLAGPLVDLCGFLKGLEDIERERRWPARSAKLVIGLGLSALARHYGLASVATGAATSGAIRNWRAPGARSALG